MCLLALVPPGIVAVDETEYDHVAAMPAFGGELQSTETWHDARTGIVARKRVLTSGVNGLALSTHVVEAACGRLAADAEPFIVAFQFRVREPRSRAAATLGAVLAEVYVRDPAGRIRVYRELGGRAMGELTLRLQPECRGL